MRSVLFVLTSVVVAGSAAAQTPPPPWRGENLQYFRRNIPRPELVQRMREFSFALDVRCQHCHSGGDGVSFDGVNFAADDKPAKVKARAKLRMVDQLIGSTLAQLPARSEPRVTVGCATCHRGLAVPKSLQTTLLEVINAEGVAAALARYRQLRADTLVDGKYNFDEWEINELARRLTEAANTAAAIAILELNGEFNPTSAEIEFLLTELRRSRGETDRAVARYRAVLAKNPQHQAAKRWLSELTKP